MTEGDILPSIGIRRPTKDDIEDIYNLIRNSKTLDLNSEYLYLLLSTHFSSTCRVAIYNNIVIGFTSSYVLPDDSSMLFIWQIAVDENFRGKNIAFLMINDIIATIDISHISATIAPSIKSSKRVFEKIATHYNTNLISRKFFSKDDFSSCHEEELLYTIRIKEHR